MSIAPDGARTRRSGWIPWTFVAAFGVILAANGALVHYALSSRVGLVDDAPYERGLATERLIAEADREATLGWTLRITPGSLDGDGVVIALDLADHEGALADATATVRLTRPIEGDATAMVEVPVVGGHGTAHIAGVRPGQWDVAVVARRADQTVRFFRRVVLS